MESIELVNHYLDLSTEILKNISFDNSHLDYQNRLIFCISTEKSLDAFADEVYKKENLHINNFDEKNFSSKFESIKNNYPSNQIINNENKGDGIIYLFKDLFAKEIDQVNSNLITTSNENNLKKFSLLLDRYKEWINFYRKIHDEC